MSGLLSPLRMGEKGLESASIPRSARKAAVIELARSWGFEEAHAVQVTKLALELYGGLPPPKKNREWEREWLEYASLLHDIGYINGVRRHHKVSEAMICRADLIGFRRSEKQIIAAVARAHRKRFPDADDPVFDGLGDDDRESVRRLAGVLRIADGFDRTHRGLITSAQMRVSRNDCTISCKAVGGVDEELRAAGRKSDVLQELLGVPVKFIVVSSGGFPEREGENGTTP